MTGAHPDLAMIINGLDEEVRAMLREDLPAQRDAVIAAIDAEEWQQAHDIVHTVNGSASFCRLRELQSAATELETCLSNKQAATPVIHKFLSTINDTLVELDR